MIPPNHHDESSKVATLRWFIPCALLVGGFRRNTIQISDRKNVSNNHVAVRFGGAFWGM